VAGDATFAGGSTAGLLEVGTLVIGGDFTQSSISSTSSFAPGQFFETQFSSTAEQLISFETSGVAESHFGILTVGNATAGVSLQTAVTAVGELTTNLGGTGNLIRGNGNPLEVAGINASSIIFDDAPLTIVDGVLTTSFVLDDVTFQNMPVDEAQLTIRRSGNILDMGLGTGVAFTTQPDVENGGVYIHADDTDPNDGNGLVINVFNPSPNPIDVEIEISTDNGAIINWDAA
jgi:hypothetical protein